MRRIGMPGQSQVTRQATFGMNDNGQIVMFEGCIKCGLSRLDHSPIKIPYSEWEENTESPIPSLTRWYDLVCFKCACAIMAPWWSITAWWYRRQHRLKRLKLEDIKCPKIGK